MITPDMLAAEDTTAITELQKQNLLLLCKGAFPAHSLVFGAALETALIEQMGNPTEKTQILKAVLTQLNTLPAEVVESEGSTESPTFFTTPQNWKALAIDVLNALEVFLPVGSYQSWGVVQRTVRDNLMLEDDIYQALNPSKTGRRL